MPLRQIRQLASHRSGLGRAGLRKGLGGFLSTTNYGKLFGFSSQQQHAVFSLQLSSSEGMSIDGARRGTQPR